MSRQEKRKEEREIKKNRALDLKQHESSIITSVESMKLNPNDIMVININVDLKDTNAIVLAEQQYNAVKEKTQHERILVVMNQAVEFSTIPEEELNTLGYFREGTKEQSSIIQLKS